jgi:hypothetical protein
MERLALERYIPLTHRIWVIAMKTPGNKKDLRFLMLFNHLEG